jgi:hypothetical protein
MTTQPDRAVTNDAPERAPARPETNNIQCNADGKCFRDAKTLTETFPNTASAHLPAVEVIADKSATMSQKATAAQHLFEHSEKDANGRVSFKVKEGDTEREYSISSVKAGAKTNINAIFTKDAQGADHPVLRWVDRGGRIEQQVGAHGRVNFESKYATEKMPDNSVAHVGNSHRPAPAHHSERQGLVHTAERLPPEPTTSDRAKSKYDRHGETPERRAEPTDRASRPTSIDGTAATRPVSDWNHFYRAQTRGNNCLPAAMSMMYADWAKGSPASGGELSQIEHVTHVGGSGGYTGSASDIGKQAQSIIPGLRTEAFQGLDRRALGAELDKQLAQGHTVIAGIKSPYSSNNHYIYVAGKDNHGNYLIGDSGRQGGGILGKTIGREDLLNRMMSRNGGSRMVAGHSDATTPATNVEGTAASRYAHLSSSRGAHERPAPQERTETRPQPVPETRTEARPQPRPETRTETRPQPRTEARPEARIEARTEHPPSGSDRIAHKLPHAIVDVPKDLDPTKPIHFVTHFNGWGSSFEHAYRSAQLDEQMRNAPPNTVLISARWQDHQFSKNSSLNAFAAGGGLRSTLAEAFKGVPELQRTGLAPGDTLGLSSFSAGYNAVNNVLADKALANRVTKITMFDSPSSKVRGFVYDHLRDFAEGKRQLTVISGDWRSKDYRAFSSELSRQFRAAKIDPGQYIYDGRKSPDRPDMEAARSKGLSFIYTKTNHSNIPGKWFAAGAF